MRIHRTTPTRAFSVFANALIRDRSISWCAVGVLTYLLSLPNGARATIRTLAEQRTEGRAWIAAALRELEESRYLRRVVREDRETGQLSTVYEVFDTPYDEEPSEGEPEKIQNLASGESATAASGALGAADALRLAPLVEEWWELGETSAQVRAALAQGLSSRVYSPRALVEDCLRRKRPACRAKGPTARPVTTVEVETRKPGASAYREAARRGGAVARALLRGQPAPA